MLMLKNPNNVLLFLMFENTNVENVTKTYNSRYMERSDSYLSISVKCLESGQEMFTCILYKAYDNVDI